MNVFAQKIKRKETCLQINQKLETRTPHTHTHTHTQARSAASQGEQGELRAADPGAVLAAEDRHLHPAATAVAAAAPFHRRPCCVPAAAGLTVATAVVVADAACLFVRAAGAPGEERRVSHSQAGLVGAEHELRAAAPLPEGRVQKVGVAVVLHPWRWKKARGACLGAMAVVTGFVMMTIF